jgi:hypothetical protein
MYTYMGGNYNSRIWVGKDFKPSTGINIPINTRVCLEVNTHGDTGLFHQ